MSDIDIRITGNAGRITLTRPQALNAITYAMCKAIDAAFVAWRDDPAVKVVILDATGERAFCSGGDIAELYETGTKGDYGYGQTFWADEYRLNNRIFTYPKPVVSFLQGFVMGGGVGIGCHGTDRIVGETSQIAMPECGIGLVPDVGGSRILAQAPGRLGDYLGLSAARMNPADAILAGFADHFIAQDRWPALIAQLEETGDASILSAATQTPPDSALEPLLPDIDRLFAGDTLGAIIAALSHDQSDFAQETLKKLQRNAPLSMACTLEILKRLRSGLGGVSMARALDLEYRFTYRASEHGDFLEGIRAAIIDKDRTPAWQYADQVVPPSAVEAMLEPLGDNVLKLEDHT